MAANSGAPPFSISQNPAKDQALAALPPVAVIPSEINPPLIKIGFPEKVGNFFNRIIEGPRICLSQDAVGGVRLSLIMDIARYRGHP